MGRIGEWAPLAAKAPWLVNAATSLPGLAFFAKLAAGVARQRSLPRFARRTFAAQFEAMQHARRDPTRTSGARRGEPVLLFPDTFSNYFRPETALAAVKVLEASGARVDLPREKLCCGRPYYDFGLLDDAKQALQKIVAALGPQIESGTPIVVLEPGCHSVFKDEMLKLLPDSAAAARLSKQVVSLGEVLAARGWTPPRQQGRALLHTHCHQKALGSAKADIALLQAAGLDVDAPDSGCCGMAGSFGFRPETYEASVKIANLSVLPAVRQAGADALIVSNGFSCREQVEGLAGRETLHLAEVLARGLN
jgi:Fe-S oxidoreductase